eukprot:CAMPEP_0197843464 /NCGR_PEP_ID=MMETSP1438-20131217/342_1 /TAXON_ID=1461541 /ORGANISM="Pterosperma sp., Strain CCMP1384" /LENGTH=373 /DNA_ID=CAMNT_0043453639 /DNA_START=110 /DNA_END=1231 /DNA_ORIENTATION=+
MSDTEKAMCRKYPAEADFFLSGPLCVAGSQQGKGISSRMLDFSTSKIDWQYSSRHMGLAWIPIDVEGDQDAARERMDAYQKAGGAVLGQFSHGDCTYNAVAFNKPESAVTVSKARLEDAAAIQRLLADESEKNGGPFATGATRVLSKAFITDRIMQSLANDSFLVTVARSAPIRTPFSTEEAANPNIGEMLLDRIEDDSKIVGVHFASVYRPLVGGIYSVDDIEKTSMSDPEKAMCRKYPAESNFFLSGPLCVEGGQQGKGISSKMIDFSISRIDWQYSSRHMGLAWIPEGNQDAARERMDAYQKAGGVVLGQFDHEDCTYNAVAFNNSDESDNAVESDVADESADMQALEAIIKPYNMSQGDIDALLQWKRS